MNDITGTVHATLAKHYPGHVLGWVKRATWKAHPAVPLTKIDMSRRPGGRDPVKVQGIADAVKAGKKMPPVVLVDTGEPQLQVADGYHRTLGFQKAGKTTIPAMIASGVGKHGPWEKRMHAAKLNLTAEHVHVVDLAGVCTGPGPCDTTPFGAGDNWVNKVGGLPLYMRAVAKAFRRKGLSESEAIQRAIGVVKNWAEGKGGVTPATRARAAAAVAEWERKKVQAHSLTAEPAVTVDLTQTIAATSDSPTLTVPAGPHRYRHGWLRIDAAGAGALERATRAVATDGHALLHGAGMVPTAQRVIERLRGQGHKVSVNRVDVAGTPHLHIARQTVSDYTADAAATVDLAWDESLHPRKSGKFAPKGSVSTSGAGHGGHLPANMAANVRDFQRRNNLPVTGVIDTATGKKIRAAAAKSGSKRKSGKTAPSAQMNAAARAINKLTPAQRAAYRQTFGTVAGYRWSGNTLVRA